MKLKRSPPPGPDARGHAPRPNAQVSGDVIKIGIITDMSGLYSDIDGGRRRRGHQDGGGRHGRRNGGKKVEVVFADHQNKADVAPPRRARWFDTAGVGHADRRHQLRHQPGDGQGGGREEEAFIVIGAATGA